MSDPSTLDLVLRGGLVLDGTGSEPRVEDVAIQGDRVVARSSRSGPIEARGGP